MPEESAHSHHHSGRTSHRHRHKSASRRGKIIVLFMALLVFTFLGIFLYMVLEGEAHPFAAGWDRTTLLTAHGLFTFVSILCLFRLYRGSTSVKHLMGLAAAIAIFMFAILLTLNFLNELSTVWMALDAFGLLVSGFLVWACFFSRSVSGFLNHQQDAR